MLGTRKAHSHRVSNPEASGKAAKWVLRGAPYWAPVFPECLFFFFFFSREAENVMSSPQFFKMGNCFFFFLI